MQLLDVVGAAVLATGPAEEHIADGPHQPPVKRAGDDLPAPPNAVSPERRPDK
jgi:hypothetical protein